MDVFTLLMLAIGLSMDAFAVAMSNGLCMNSFKMRDALKIGLAFGAAQGIMPILGYLAGRTFSEAIMNADHWIALILLSIIGGKMIFEAIDGMKKGDDVICRVLTNKMLFVQAVATSIDALAVGISLALIRVNIWLAASFIGVITFTLSVIGVIIGKKSGKFLKTKAELVGGIILVLIGVKIFLEHVMA